MFDYLNSDWSTQIPGCDRHHKNWCPNFPILVLTMSDYYGKLRTMENIDMYEKIATISWCPLDVKQLYPHWSDEKCADVLDAVSGYLEDRSVELGWEVLENLTSDYDKENENE